VACSEVPVVRKTRQQKFKDKRIRISDNMSVRLMVVMTMAVCVVMAVMEMMTATTCCPSYAMAEEEEHKRMTVVFSKGMILTLNVMRVNRTKMS
jgi:flagellar basal body-associated protein FliL